MDSLAPIVESFQKEGDSQAQGSVEEIRSTLNAAFEYAAMVAKAKGISVVFLGAGTGGELKGLSDVSIVVPEKETYKVQELRLPVYHCLCAMLEEEFY